MAFNQQCMIMEGVDAPPVLRYRHQSSWVLWRVNLFSGIGTSRFSDGLLEPHTPWVPWIVSMRSGLGTSGSSGELLQPPTNIYSTVSGKLHINNSLTTCDRLHVPSFPSTLRRRDSVGWGMQCRLTCRIRHNYRSRVTGSARHLIMPSTWRQLYHCQNLEGLRKYSGVGSPRRCPERTTVLYISRTEN